MFSPLKSKAKFLQRAAVADSTTRPAPVGGLNTRDSLATMSPLFATFMRNWFPAEKELQIRKGAAQWATGLPSKALHLAAWRGAAGTSKLFAFTDSGAYDVTSSGPVGAVSSAMTSGEVASINFNTTGGSFLFVVNGADDTRYFNGSTWTTTASYTISGGGTLLSSDISNLASFKRFIFFIERASMNFHYLPVDSISGSVTKFPLGALFNKGGYLAAMGNWSLDGGLGIDDYAVFMTSEGQVAVYTGSDPSDATNWSLKGVYDLGRPLGKNCLFKLGADLVAITTLGITSLTKVIQGGQYNEKTTITDKISSLYQYAALTYGQTRGWQLVQNQAINLLMLNIPRGTSTGNYQLAMNLITGAWTEFSGWNTDAMVLDGTQLHGSIGTSTYKLWTDTDDFGNRIVAKVRTAWTYLSPRSCLKQIRGVRAMLEVEGRADVSIALDADFRDADTYSPAFTSAFDSYRYDSAEFDTATWGALGEMRLDWLTVPCPDGYAFAMRMRVISGAGSVKWSASDYLYESGTLQG